MVNMKKSLLFLPLLFCLVSCAPKKQTHGYMPTPSQVALLKPGVSSKAQVVQLIGTPAFINDFADNRWNYVAFRTEQIGFEKPDIVNYDVLQLVFNDEQILQSLQQSNRDSLVELSYDTEATPASGREMGLMEQFLGNIGKFN